MEHEREKIITELEGIVKFSTCPEYVQKAFALIIELTEENERLKEKADRNFNNLKAVLEERSENTIVADTVRKMQERLKEYLDDFYNSGEDALLDVPDLIDQIAKEMMGVD